MTPYERGYAAGLKAAAEQCKSYAKGGNAIAADPKERSQIRNSAAIQALAAEYCADNILSLPIHGEADQLAKGEDSRTEQSCENGAAHPNPGEQECVMVPVEPTRAMVDAACAAGDNGNLSGQYLRNIWKAMLAAREE